MSKGHNSKRHDSTGKQKATAYKNAKRREHNKIKRILQSNGLKAAQAYSLKHGVRVPARMVAA